MARATRIALDVALAASKALRPGCATVWRYAKVEMIPPSTQMFFHGAGGKKLENTVAKFADRFITGLEGKIREIEAEKERQIKAKEAAIRAAHEKAVAEAKKQEQLKLQHEAMLKAREAKQAKEKAEKAEKIEKEAEVKAKPKKPDAKPKKPRNKK